MGVVNLADDARYRMCSCVTESARVAGEEPRAEVVDLERSRVLLARLLGGTLLAVTIK